MDVVAMVFSLGTSVMLVWLFLSCRNLKKEMAYYKKIATSSLLVYRNPDGGNGPKGQLLIGMTFENMFLASKYGGGLEERLTTAYGTITLEIEGSEKRYGRTEEAEVE